jgi:hypothetical protein
VRQTPLVGAVTLAALVALPNAAHSQSTGSPACHITGFLVVTPTTIMLRCDETDPSLPAAELWKIDEVVPGDPRLDVRKVADLDVSTVSMRGRGTTVVPNWLRLEIRKGQPPLVGLARYTLHVPAVLPPSAPSGQAREPYWYEFATEPEGEILDAAESIDSGKVLRLFNPIALVAPASPPQLVYTKDGRAQVVPATMTISEPSPVPNVANPDDIGEVRIELTGSRLRATDAKLAVKGITDIFGNSVAIPPAARTEIVGRNLSGRSKDEVGTYIKFGHETGAHKRSVWTLDAKAEVELPQRLKGWRVIPYGVTDIGLGTTETTNMIRAGVVFTQFTANYPRETTRSSASVLQGARFIVAPSFETDRDFESRNLLVDIDVEPSFRGLYNPLARQNRIRLQRAQRQRPKAKMDEIEPATIGYALVFNAGIEAGGALDDRSHGILRLRPRVRALFEYKRLTLDAHAALRALLATERTSVEAGGTLAVQELDMWQPYSHVGLSFAFAEHAALDSTYKVGYQPPTFRRVNVVQTGIAFRF